MKRLALALALAPLAQTQGLHGYIGYSSTPPPNPEEFSAGMGFYSAVWPLIDEPLANFQIGLAGSWILPDNSDNKDTPLAPEGTLARKWPERGPTWGSVFQTLEGGLGYWRGNRFRYGPPKFSMNATPQCYDYEVGSPGWSFFYDTEALPDEQLGIAQLSNRLLIPPDALPFEGNPRGKFLGYTYMALPFTDPVEVDLKTGRPPTGDQAWTCFLATKNFKGPIAYYIPETWSKIGQIFDEPFLYGRGLDARRGRMDGGAMEVNTVPHRVGKANDGTLFSRIPRLNFPTNQQGQAILVQDVTFYSRAALFDGFLAWRKDGKACTGEFQKAGTYVAKLTTRSFGFKQDGQRIDGIENIMETRVFDEHAWGLQWKNNTGSEPESQSSVETGRFPEYFRQDGERRVAVPSSEVPNETGLKDHQFELAQPGAPFVSPAKGAWTKPGPATDPIQVQLTDGSTVTYCWYRFIDQPSFQQYEWSPEKRTELQHIVERVHREWPIDRNYMAPLRKGELASLDPALLVTPPEGMEFGYVPIVTRQERTE